MGQQRVGEQIHRGAQSVRRAPLREGQEDGAEEQIVVRGQACTRAPQPAVGRLGTAGAPPPADAADLRRPPGPDSAASGAGGPARGGGEPDGTGVGEKRLQRRLLGVVERSQGTCLGDLTEVEHTTLVDLLRRVLATDDRRHARAGG